MASRNPNAPFTGGVPAVTAQKTIAQRPTPGGLPALPLYTTAQMNAYSQATRRVFFQQMGIHVPGPAPFGSQQQQPPNLQGSLAGPAPQNAAQFAQRASAVAKRTATRAFAKQQTAMQIQRSVQDQVLKQRTRNSAFYAKLQAQAAHEVSVGANTAARLPSAPGDHKSAGPWITAGNDEGVPCCTAVAVANHLYISTGLCLTDEQVWMLHAAAGSEDVRDVLKAASSGELWDNVILEHYVQVPASEKGALVIGFPTPRGYHTALLLPDDTMASWGESLELPDTIEEAWALQWQMVTQITS